MFSSFYSGGKAFVPQALFNSEPYGGCVSILLHEYGHLVDARLGHENVGGGVYWLSDQEPFKSVFEKSKSYKHTGLFRKMSFYEMERSTEFFAESFAKFYHSKDSREELQDEFPEAHSYFEGLENKIKTGKKP